MKPVKTWILIADAARARVVENLGPGKGIHALAGMEFHGPKDAARDIMSDDRGRTFNSSDGGRHAKEPATDPTREQARRFVGELVQTLEQHHRAGAFDRLVVVAAPATLGDLRGAFSKGITKLIAAEVSKDLTHARNDELPRLLDDVLVA
jgi:protein required for attachment to host cells